MQPRPLVGGVLPVHQVESLRELYAATHRRLVIAVAGVAGDVGEAEECVAEAFARAISRWDRICRYEDPEGWIRRVAVNVARSRWRRLRRMVSAHLRPPETAPLSEDHVALMNALRKLPRPQRDAIVLHYLVDMSVDEVAIHQRVPVGTVKARLSRGRRALARQLAWPAEEVDVP